MLLREGMTPKDREWLEGRLRDLYTGFKSDTLEMERRIMVQIQSWNDDHNEKLEMYRNETQKQFADLIRTMHKRFDEHSKQIRSLEMWRNYISGAIGAAGFLLGMFWDKIFNGR